MLPDWHWSDPHFSQSGWQRQSALWPCGGVWGGWDDSCHLLSRKYTRDPPHSKHPNAHLPFLSTASHPVQFSPEEEEGDRRLFFHVGQSLCLRVSVGSLPGPVTGRRASILILGCLCVTRAVFSAAARKGEIMPRMPLPPRVKPAVRRQNQHLTSQHGENLDFICFCPTEERFHNSCYLSVESYMFVKVWCRSMTFGSVEVQGRVQKPQSRKPPPVRGWGSIPPFSVKKCSLTCSPRCWTNTSLKWVKTMILSTKNCLKQIFWETQTWINQLRSGPKILKILLYSTCSLKKLLWALIWAVDIERVFP